MKNVLAYYYCVRGVKRGKHTHTLYVYADNIRIENGDLLLLRKEKETGEMLLYRAFAKGSWREIFSASCFTGEEVYEEHDYNETTGKDAYSL